MGNACCSKKKGKRKIVLLLLGLDNAGKTVAAKGLAGEPTDDVVPTIGFHCVNLSLKHFHVKVYDLGGAENFRGIWHRYFSDAYGIIFVIDSSDYQRLDEAKRVLESVLAHGRVSGKPLLLLANKQDSENALDEIDLHEQLNLEDLVNTYQCPTLVECCSATESGKKSKVDSGITKGFSWLISFIDTNYDSLNSRVNKDIKLQEEEEKKLRDEIIKRIQLSKQLERDEDEDAIELYSEYSKKLSTAENGKVSNGTCLREAEVINGNIDDEFPRLYYGTVGNDKLTERPKSAREFVRDQLQLACNGDVGRKSNKTQPVHLIGANLSHSARERSKRLEVPRRLLRSAGDVKSSIHLPNMVVPIENGDSWGNNLEFECFTKTCRFLPLDISPKVKIHNGISWSKSEDENDISIIHLS